MDREQLEQWKTLPTTVEVLEQIELLIQEIKDNWAECRIPMDNIEVYALENAKMQGQIKGLESILNIDIE